MSWEMKMKMKPPSRKSKKKHARRKLALRQVGLSNVSTASAQGAKLTNALLARVPAGSSPAASRLRSKAFNAVAADDADAPLVAGGNIAVFYNSGDSLTGAVGTVTAICGNEVWAFGHPMDFAGATTPSRRIDMSW